MIEVSGTGSVTGDTAAMQDALSQGGRILLDDHLQVTTPLRFTERTHLTIGPHGALERAGSPGLIRNRWPDDNFPGYSGRGDLLIDGPGVLDMAGDKTGDTALAASAITLAHAENVTVRDITIRNVPGAHGFDLLGCRNVTIDNVTFEGYLANPADPQPRESIQIDGCYKLESGDCAPADSTFCDDVVVRGCRFQASDVLPAPQRAVGSHGWADKVTGHEPRHIKVIDNTMDGCTDSAIYAWKWFESIIARNIILTPGKNGIVVQSLGRDVDVEHNQIFDAGNSGIWVNDSCDNIAIHGNRIIGASAAVNNTHYGIRISSNCVTCVITDNRVRRRGAGANDAKYGLSIADGSKMYRHGNHLIWSGVTGSLQDLSTSPTTSAADAL